VFHYCQQHWPVVLFKFQGEQSLSDHQTSLDLWDKLLAQKEDVVVIRVFQDESALIHAPGVGKLTRQWLTRGAGNQIRQQVKAMINIVPDTAYPRMQHMSVEQVFGVPGGIFSHPETAIDWFENAELIPDMSLASYHFLIAD